ncbi:MAG: hypothetical protein RJR35_00115 [Thermoanaerobacterales bacterium]|nr:hypothetical protein [Thermoanaerobacterales bacterium]
MKKIVIRMMKRRLPVEDIQEESDSEETVSDDVLEYMGLGGLLFRRKR